MNPDWNRAARETVERCRQLASYTEDPGWTTRTYLSKPMHDVHRALTEWLEPCGCDVHIDAAGNLRAVRRGGGDAPRLVIGSHLDTVIHAGAFDGILGVVMGVALIEALGARELPFGIELIGFSEEEGVRFGVPFLGSRAVTGDLDDRAIALMAAPIREFGLNAAELPLARLRPPVAGYLEFHIEQGPVLEQLGLPLGIVDAIAGQSRLGSSFRRQRGARRHHSAASAQRSAHRRSGVDRRSGARNARHAGPGGYRGPDPGRTGRSERDSQRGDHEPGCSPCFGFDSPRCDAAAERGGRENRGQPLLTSRHGDALGFGRYPDGSGPYRPLSKKACARRAFRCIAWPAALAMTP